MKYMMKKHNNYSIRKLTIGVVSVLIGLSFITDNHNVKAAESLNNPVPTSTKTGIKESLTNNNSKGQGINNSEKTVKSNKTAISLKSADININSLNVKSSVKETENTNLKDNSNISKIEDVEPQVQKIITLQAGNPVASDGIANLKDNVPGYPTSVKWIKQPDTIMPGSINASAQVTYPDGTTKTVTIPIDIVNNQPEYEQKPQYVITHKTSNINIIGNPALQYIKIYYLNFRDGKDGKPFIYTINANGDLQLTQRGDLPSGYAKGDIIETFPKDEFSFSWLGEGVSADPIYLPGIIGHGRPTSIASADNGGTGTICYTMYENNQGYQGYPKYISTLDVSNLNFPLVGQNPHVGGILCPFVYIYGAKANGEIPNLSTNTKNIKQALGDPGDYVDASDLTAAHNAEISSIKWQELPNITQANSKASATVRINFKDGSYLDVPITVNVTESEDNVVYKDITRTINIEGQDKPIVQHIIFTGTKNTDLSKPIAQQITYTNIKAKDGSTFSQVDVAKLGYTATADGIVIQTINGKQYVPSQQITDPNSKNIVINVTYSADDQQVNVIFKDTQGNTIDKQIITGKTDTQVNLKDKTIVPDGWKIVGNDPRGEYTFQNTNPDVTVIIEQINHNDSSHEENHDGNTHEQKPANDTNTTNDETSNQNTEHKVEIDNTTNQTNKVTVKPAKKVKPIYSTRIEKTKVDTNTKINKDNKILPKTSETNNNLNILGLLSIGLIGIFITGINIKKHRN